MKFRNNKFKITTVLAIAALLPLFFYGWRISLRPSRTNTTQVISPGITYKREAFNTPRPYIVHIVEIDLTKPNIKPLVTPANDGGDNIAMTTSKFVEKYGLTLAVNGSFFAPFKEITPWNYYPKSGDTVNALGGNVSNSKPYGKAYSRWNVLCFKDSKLASIPDNSSCRVDTVQGIAGKELLVKDGILQIDDPGKAYARNAVGINKKGDRLWLIIVDGKQPYYSEGVTQKELAEIAIKLGADRALNLDGGGSTTLIIKQGNKAKVFNAPIHTKIPMRERPVANHLGFY